jgi:hypothetical protein
MEVCFITLLFMMENHFHPIRSIISDLMMYILLCYLNFLNNETSCVLLKYKRK